MPTSLHWLEKVSRMNSLQVDAYGINIGTDKFPFGTSVLLHWWKHNTSLMLTDILHK